MHESGADLRRPVALHTESAHQETEFDLNNITSVENKCEIKLTNVKLLFRKYLHHNYNGF